MNILVLNCGSSSIKYQLLEMGETTIVKAKGQVDKIGLPLGSFVHKPINKDKFELEQSIPTHTTGLNLVINALVDENHGVISSLNEIAAVGHRVVNGGEKFTQSVKVTPDVLKEILACSDLAPLHTPANIQGAQSMSELMPDVPQVLVFDTAFHQTMPKHAFLYACPMEYYEKYGIRRYGFHGTSHGFVSKRACEILNVDINTQKIVVCHLGNGASICAVKHGKSVDTSMGFTPLAGLMMGTRAGDIDSDAVTYIMNKEGLTPRQMSDVLNKKSGLVGISNISSDMREIVNNAEQGVPVAKLTLEMFDYRVRKYIGSYAAAMGGIDTIVFTGGIGENSNRVRTSVCKELGFLGVTIDEEKNAKAQGEEGVISTGKVNVVIVPTNEELVIAQDTVKIAFGQ